MDEVGVLQDLVAAYSPPGKEATAVIRFIQHARALGFSTEVDEAGNGIARRGDGRPQVLFLGHIDTVEGALPVRVSGGYIHGRGTCDAKGALVAALFAARSHRGPGEIVVVAAIGEERDSRGARYLIPRRAPDFLVVGEPSGWSGVTLGYKGNMSLVLRFEGERSHLSSPFPTTVESALSFIGELREFCRTNAGLTPFSSVTAKVHSIDTRRSGGQEVVNVGVNLRLPPAVSTHEVRDFLDAHGMAGHYEVIDSSEAVECDRKGEVVRALDAGIRSLGGSPTHLRKSGTSDMNLAVPAWRCAAAAYGPGDAHLGHTNEERLSIEDLEGSIGVLSFAFADLASRAVATPVPHATVSRGV